jgi:hypothetical protein
LELRLLLFAHLSPGIVTWKPKQTKTFLDNILLVESNASFGNSGGPVFSLNNGFKGDGGFSVGGDPSLVGILVSGTIETNEVKANGKNMVDFQGNILYMWKIDRVCQ